jgi:hypothetical protein
MPHDIADDHTVACPSTVVFWSHLGQAGEALIQKNIGALLDNLKRQELG